MDKIDATGAGDTKNKSRWARVGMKCGLAVIFLALVGVIASMAYLQRSNEAFLKTMPQPLKTESKAAEGVASEIVIEYHVQERDTLESVSMRVYGDAAHVGEIAALNGIEDPDAIETGRVLRIRIKGEALP